MTTPSRPGTSMPLAALLRNPRLVLRSLWSGGGERREIELDVVRGVAILFAITWHIGQPRTGIVVFDAAMAPMRYVGWAGVDLFFVLSGFLIGRLVLGEAQRFGSVDTRRFLLRRALRLWPALYVYLLAQLAMGSEEWTTYFFQTLLHLQNYTGSSIEHLWSLAVEEHFYLGIALMMAAAPAILRSPRRLAWGLGGLMATALLLRCAGVALGVNSYALQQQTQFRMDALACGLLLATLSLHYPEVFGELLRRKVLMACVTVAGGLFLASTHPRGMVMAAVGYTVSMLASAAFLLLAYRSGMEHRAGWLVRPLAWLGGISYSLYLWHGAAALAAVTAFQSRYPDASVATLTVVRYAGAIAFAYVAVQVAERPAIRLRDLLVPRRGHVPSPAPSATQAAVVPGHTAPEGPAVLA